MARDRSDAPCAFVDGITAMSDMLDMDKLNQLPQPLMVYFSKSDKYPWPVYDIDVETGLMRIDVCGKLDLKHFAEVVRLQDANGDDHDPDNFFLE